MNTARPTKDLKQKRILTVLITVVVLFILFAVIKRGLVNTYLKAFLEKTISFELRAKVQIIDLKVEILKSSIHARGVRINGFGNVNSIFLAKDVKVFFKPFPIFLRKIIVPKIELSDVALQIPASELQKADIEHFFKKSKRRGIIDFEVGRLSARNVEVSTLNEMDEAYLNLKAIEGNFSSKNNFLKIEGNALIAYKNNTVLLPTIFANLKPTPDGKKNLEVILESTSGAGLKFSGAVSPSFDLKGTLKGDLESLALNHGVFQDFAGEAKIPFSLTGDYARPLIKGSVSASNLSYKSLSFYKVTSEFEFKDKILTVKNGTLENKTAKLAFTADAKFQGKIPLNFEVDVNDLRLDLLNKKFLTLESSLDGVFNGKLLLKSKDVRSLRGGIDLKGTVKGFSIKANNPASYGPHTILFGDDYEIIAKGMIENSSIEVENFQLLGKKSRVKIEGKAGSSVAFANYNLSFFDLSSVSVLGNQFKGEMVLAGNLKYSSGLLSGDGILTGQNILLENFNFGNLSSNYSVDNSILDFKNIKIRGKKSSLNGKVLINIKNPSDLSINADFNKVDFPLLSSLLLKKYELSKSISGEVDGSFSYINSSKKTSGDLLLKADQLGLFGESNGIFALKASLEGSLITLDSMKLSIGSQEILRGEGFFDLGGDSNLEFEGMNLGIDFFDFLKVKKYFGESKVSFKLLAKGQKGSRQMSGWLNLKEDYDERPKRDLLDLSYNTDFELLDIKGNFLGKEVSYDISYPLKEEGIFKIDIATSDFAFVPYLQKKVTLNTAKTRGSLTMIGSLSGKPGQPSSYRGVLDIEEFKIGKDDITIANSLPIQLELFDKRWKITSLNLKGENTDLFVRGGGELSGENNIDVEGFANMNILSIFFKEFIRAEGRLNLTASVEGTFRDVNIVGSANLKDGVLVIRDFPNIINNLSTDITFSKKKILLDNIIAELGGGKVKGFGSMEIGDFDGGIYFDATTELTEVSSLFPIDYPSVVSGTITFKGPYFTPTLGGDLTIHKLRYSKPWDWRSKIISFGTKNYDLGIRLDPEIFLDLNVRADKGNIEIKNNVTESLLSGQIRILGDDKKVGALGTINVDRGKVDFLDNEFELTGGTIKFVDATSALAIFDVNAKTKVKGTEIFLHLQGTSDEPEMILTSLPVKSETDIVTLLTLGVDSTELTSVGGAQSELSQSLVTSVLTGVIQDNIEKTFRKTKILDTFQVYPSFSEETRTTELRVGIGKKIPYEMEILYSTDVNNIGKNQEVIINKGITENLSLQGILKEKTDERVDLGIDFEFKIDF